MSAVGQVCNRIIRYVCTFDCKLHDWMHAIVLSTLLFGVWTFTCVVTLFFRFVIAKSVIQFFTLLYFGIFHRVYTSVVCSCVLIYVLVCLYFGFVYMFAWLSYFLQWFSNLINCFFLPNYSYLHFLIILQVLSVWLPRF